MKRINILILVFFFTFIGLSDTYSQIGSRNDVRHTFSQSTLGITTASTGTAIDMTAFPMSKLTMVVDRTAGATNVVEIDLKCSIGSVFVQIASILDLTNEPVLVSIDGTVCQDIQYDVVTVGSGNTLTIELLAAR